MELKGYVYDNQTGNGIPFASVAIVNSAGKSYNDGTVADDYGYFELNSDLLNTVGWLMVSSAGYNPIMVHPGVFQESGDIGLDENSELPADVFTFKINKETWPLWILGGALLLLLLKEADKQKKMGKVSPQDAKEWFQLALYVGIPVAAFFLIVKPLLIKLGILKDPSEQAQDKSDQEAQQDQGTLNKWNPQENHTFSRDTLDSVAVALRDITTSWYHYSFDLLPGQIAYLAGFTVADAKYFIGTFVEKNGETLWAWYKNKFQNSVILTPLSWGLITWPDDYSRNFEKVGANKEYVDGHGWSDVIGKFVNYVYKLAGVSKQ